MSSSGSNIRGMSYPIHEGCCIPGATQFRGQDHKGNWAFYNLDAQTPIPPIGERPPNCGSCTKCMPKVARGTSVGLSTYEIIPETVKKL